MKDSGVECIGEIPEEWEFVKLKYLVNLRSEKMLTDENTKYLGMENIESGTGQYLETESEVDKTENVVFKSGDILFGKLRPYLEKIWKAEFDGTASSEFLIFKDSKLDKDFLFYSLFSDGFIKNVNSSTYGTKMPRASWDYIQNVKIPFPSALTEQKAIAGFLDSASARFDDAGKLIKGEIDTLKTYKKSQIYEAVTKGLDAGSELKDSGVDWIGEIPVGWEVINPKYLFEEQRARATKGQEQLTASQVYGIISQKEYMNVTGSRVVVVDKAFEILKQVEPGDFVISMRSFQGGLEYSEIRGSISSAYVMLKPTRKIVDNYYKWLFKSVGYINALQSTSQLVRDGQAMRYANFVQVPLIFPNLTDQQKIADYLDEKTKQVDDIIKIKEAQLSNLTKQRKSLIYDVVTGKRRV